MESTTVPRDDWQNIWANRPEFYWGGARQANPKIYSGYATTIDGIATFASRAASKNQISTSNQTTSNHYLRAEQIT